MDDALRTQARAAQGAVREGRLRGARLLDAIHAVPFRDRDVWVDELFALDDLPDDEPGLPAGTVPYLPCGVDAVVRAVLDAPVRESDVFVDLGAGVGRVAILVHLLTAARTIGVELQAALVDRARATATLLDVTNAEFHLGDAATTEIAAGTVFFIYASFSPQVLRAVLAWLERVARTKRIVLCAVGFDVDVASHPWLTARASHSPELALYDSVS